MPGFDTTIRLYVKIALVSVSFQSQADSDTFLSPDLLKGV